MKYMHFNSSCPYAGLANLLELRGVDTEDYKIALEMNLPYFLRYDEPSGKYLAGPSLQSAQWFDLYLNPHGYRYCEEQCEKNQLFYRLRPGMMLGLRVSEQGRHAVIFLEENKGTFYFLNNRWEESDEPEGFELSKTELYSRLSETVVMGYLEQCEPKQVDYRPYFTESIKTWGRLRDELHAFMTRVQSPEALRASMDRLFRPLLLDGLTMMQLLGEEKIVTMLRELQGRYLEQLKKHQEVCLCDFLPPARIDEAISLIIDRIKVRNQSGGTDRDCNRPDF